MLSEKNADKQELPWFKYQYMHTSYIHKYKKYRKDKMSIVGGNEGK